MPAVEHVVQPGESLSSIADRYGLYWGTIWNDERNATLRQERKDPNILYPGDVLHVPALRETWRDAATGRTNQFRVKGVPSVLKLRVLRDDQPRAGVPYTLYVDGVLVEEKTIPDDGIIQVSVSPQARKGRLIIAESEEYELRLGYLNPVDKISGVKARLNNLGYDAGAVNEQWDEQAKKALAAYQQTLGKETTGELDDDTRTALRDGHDLPQS